MKKVTLIFVLLFPLITNAVDYTDAKITGVGINPEEDFIRFTIDKDVNAIFFTKLYTGERHKNVVSLILTAYAAQSKIAFLRSIEASSANTKHYTDLKVLEVGTITHD